MHGTQADRAEGASSIASAVTMPLLLQSNVPVKHRAQQIPPFIYRSEHILPPANALFTIFNLAVSGACYLNRKTSRGAAIRLPYVAAAFGFGVSVTAWSLAIMLPMNKKMIECNEKFQQSIVNPKEIEEKEGEFEWLQWRWLKLNYGKSYEYSCSSQRFAVSDALNVVRVALMASSATCGMVALLRDLTYTQT